MPRPGRHVELVTGAGGREFGACVGAGGATLSPPHMRRRLRGILGTALVWATAFASFGLLAGVLAIGTFYFTSQLDRPGMTWALLVQVVASIVRWGVIGALSGLVFATLLLTTRRPEQSEWSGRRLTLLGALAGGVGALLGGAALVAALPLSTIVGVAMLSSLALFGCLLGTGMARATLRAVRGAPAADALDAPGPHTALGA